MTTILRSKLTRCKSPAHILKAVAKINIQNLTGDINYNFYGTKDGVEFVPVGEKYIDSFYCYYFIIIILLLLLSLLLLLFYYYYLI